MKYLALMIAVLPGMAAAQPLPSRSAPVPAAVRAWVTELAGMCRDSGGRPGRSPQLTKFADLTGDGVTDYVVDTGAFNCEGAASALVNGQQGADLKVFVGGAGNTATQAWQGSVYSNTIETKAGRPRLWVGLSGLSCGQRNAARLTFAEQAACERALDWDPRRRGFVLGVRR